MSVPSVAKNLVVHILYSFGTGGLEKGIAAVVGGASPGFGHVIVCCGESGESARLLPPGTPVTELRKAPGNSPVFLWRLARVLRRLRPDVVHTRNWSGMDGVLAARLAGLRGVVHGEHGWGMDDPEGRDPRRLRVRRFLSRWVREYTCVSRAMVGWLRDEVRVRKPVTQIYNGVDTGVYRPAEDRAALRARLGLPQGGFVAGVVGRLDPIKDHRTLFQAFEGVRARLPGAHLLVVGDGPERSPLEAAAGSCPAVRFLGNRLDAPDVLRCLDLFVLPSRNEGISNTILEAMATALPVAATAVGGNPELVADGETGTLVPPGDPEALGRVLLAYAEDPAARESHGRAGRERVLREFSVASMVAAYEAVYRRVGGEGGSHR
ncbi:MAG: glycosyltransferase [Deferrisomatales bacterium]